MLILYTNLHCQLVEDELYHDVVIMQYHLFKSFLDPGLQNVNPDFGHVDLPGKTVFKLHNVLL